MANKKSEKMDGQRAQVYLFEEDRAKLAYLKKQLGLGVSAAIQLIIDNADVELISRRYIKDRYLKEMQNEA